MRVTNHNPKRGEYLELYATHDGDCDNVVEIHAEWGVGNKYVTSPGGGVDSMVFRVPLEKIQKLFKYPPQGRYTKDKIEYIQKKFKDSQVQYVTGCYLYMREKYDHLKEEHDKLNRQVDEYFKERENND